MLSKLLKLEIKSVYRYLGVVWAALLAASLLQSVTNRIYGMMIDTSSFSSLQIVLQTLPTVIYGLVLAAEIILTLVLLIARFYKGMMGDEGYLMHTLPVKTWQLIDAKGITACIAVIFSGIVVVISIWIMELIGSGYNIFSQFDFNFEGCKPNEVAGLFAFYIAVIIIFLASILAQIYRVYTALAIGQLAGRHRILMSGAAYIGISIAISIITSIAVIIASVTELDYAITITSESSFSAMMLTMGGVLLILLVEISIYHVITERILSRKLNLL